MEQAAISRGAAAGVSDRYFRFNGETGGYFTQLRTDTEVVHGTGRMNHDACQFSCDVQARQQIVAPGNGIYQFETLMKSLPGFVEMTPNLFDKAERTGRSIDDDRQFAAIGPAPQCVNHCGSHIVVAFLITL